MAGITDHYLRGEALKFFGAHPDREDDRRRAVQRAVRPLAPAVADVLEQQNARYVQSPARDAHLAALRAGAAAVVTGQQVGLFLGPLYTLYKAAAAVVDARALAAQTGEKVVPVFWLQSEDHDLPEIARCVAPPLHDEPLELQLPASPDDRLSVACCALPAEVETQLEALEDHLSHHAHAGSHLALLRRHYRPGVCWVDAFAGVIAELFADEGLVLVDPRDPALARHTATVHRTAIVEAASLSQRLQQRVDELTAAGYAASVHIRPGSPLSFFHPEGPRGPRYRLEPSETGFGEVGGTGTHTQDELLAWLEREPLRFSTSALLRPILQDTLLPTAAYVGGPGEIAYFAQLAPLFEAFKLPMPLVVPRARLRIIEPRTRRLMERLQLRPDDAALPEEVLLAMCHGHDASLPTADALSSRLLAGFEQSLSELGEPAAAQLPALARSLERTRKTVAYAVSRFARNYERARLRRDEGLVSDVRRFKALLHPEGGPQERCHGLSWYAAKWGDRALVEAVLAAIVPFDSTLKDLEP